MKGVYAGAIIHSLTNGLTGMFGAVSVLSYHSIFDALYFTIFLFLGKSTVLFFLMAMNAAEKKIPLLVILSSIIATISWLIMGLGIATHTTPIILLLGFFIGFSMGITTWAREIYLVRLSETKKIGNNVSWYISLMTISFIPVPFISGYLADAFGVHVVLFMIVLFFLLNGIMFLVIKQPNMGDIKKTPSIQKTLKFYLNLWQTDRRIRQDIIRSVVYAPQTAAGGFMFSMLIFLNDDRFIMIGVVASVGTLLGLIGQIFILKRIDKDNIKLFPFSLLLIFIISSLIRPWATGYYPLLLATEGARSLTLSPLSSIIVSVANKHSHELNFPPHYVTINHLLMAVSRLFFCVMLLMLLVIGIDTVLAIKITITLASLLVFMFFKEKQDKTPQT